MYLLMWEGAAFTEMSRLTRDDELREAAGAALAVLAPLLENNPRTAGESREDGKRVVHHNPLTIYYRVDEPRKRVEVLRVVCRR